MARLMFIHHSGLVGGAGVSLINIIKSMSKDDLLTVYVPSQPNDIADMLKKYSKENNIRVKIYGRRIGAITYYSGGDKIASLRFLYRILLILKQWKLWEREIAETDPDVVIVNSKILCWMGLLREQRKRKSICFVRETMRGKKDSFINLKITKLLNLFDRVIFLSDYDRRKEMPAMNNARVIHDYVEKSQFDLMLNRDEASDILKLKKETFHILYVGGVSEMKGFDLAVKAVLECGKDVELIVAGNAFDDVSCLSDKSIKKYAEQWRKYIEVQDIYNQVHIVGKQKNMSVCYSACDVLLFPMRSPHQSRPAFEAGYFSKPIIITDFENIAEFVYDGQNGYKIPPDDVESIVEKINILKSNKVLCEQMGKNNYKNANELHDCEKNCRLIKDIIEEMKRE